MERERERERERSEKEWAAKHPILSCPA